MTTPQNIIAMVFDFDGTLTDDSTTAFLKSRGIAPDEFWGAQKKEVLSSGADSNLWYLQRMVSEAQPGGLLEGLTNQDLYDFGKTLDFYSGLPEFFDDMRSITGLYEKHNPKVEFYILSSGIEEIIMGSSIAKYIDGIRGSRFTTDVNGVISGINNSVSFTEKTRFLFEINKGLFAPQCIDARKKPELVNISKPAEERRVPFKNMIYVGDGYTDIPCFSLIKSRQRDEGITFGIMEKGMDREQAYKKLMELESANRVDGLHYPLYSEEDELGTKLGLRVMGLCARIEAG